MSSTGDFDFMEPKPVRRQSHRRSLLPWFLIAAGVAVGVLCIVGGATAFVLLMQHENVAPAEKPVAGAPRATRLPSSSAAECERLGTRLEQAVMDGDAQAVGALYDWEIIVGRAAGGLDVSDADRRQFLAGVKQGANRQIAQRLTGAVPRGGRFDFLKTIERDGRRRALCRMITPEGGVEFFEYLPAGSGDDVRIGDAYVYSAGDEMSTIIRRGLLSIAAHNNRGLLERLTGAESDLIRHGADVAKLSEASGRSDWTEVLATYDALPESLRRDKNVLLIAMNAAALSDEGRYSELIETFREAHPGDPATDLMLIDYNYLRGRLDQSIAALRRLDARVGGDAFVKTMIARMLIEQNKGAEADRVLREAIALENDLEDTHLALVGSAVASGDHAEAVRRYDDLTRLAELDSAAVREALAAYPGSEAFFASKEFAAWEASR
ncbi:MAG: hypothetical protein WBC44_10265 [Planctomycetaceae bacterium]